MADEDVYLTRVNIHNVRHLKDIDIPLSDTERKHLIFTGINGSGKTSVLEAIRKFLGYVITIGDSIYEKKITKMSRITGIDLLFNVDYLVYKRLYISGKYIFAFFNAKRKLELYESKTKRINKIAFKEQYSIDDEADSEFIKYLISLEADRAFAERYKDIDAVSNINTWFEMFEEILRCIFEDNKIKLEFDRKSYNYNIMKKGRDKFTFNQLSDGYSAIFDIILELIMRMEQHRTTSYDIQGVVLIDEIDAHLHVSLQKKILPFLTAFFPRVQFIVTTHSPFILNSIENAVIYDLQNNIRASDFSGYSYDGIVEVYFDNDTYAQDVKDKIKEYELLVKKHTTLTKEEKSRMIRLRMYLQEIPASLSKGLKLKFMQIESKRKENESQTFKINLKGWD
ncbi:MAG: AAA family ATPase [Nitrospirae bacterium]|nr:AAA family ATPase [Nitrospirota bacterium]